MSNEKNDAIARHKVVMFLVDAGGPWPTLEDAHDAAEEYIADLITAGRSPEPLGPLDKLDSTGSAAYVGKVPPALEVAMPAGTTLINYASNDFFPPPVVRKAKIKARRAKRGASSAR